MLANNALLLEILGFIEITLHYTFITKADLLCAQSTAYHVGNVSVLISWVILTGLHEHEVGLIIPKAAR